MRTIKGRRLVVFAPTFIRAKEQDAIEIQDFA
jgi:hypothetical protein